jgi:hypothetical protein
MPEQRPLKSKKPLAKSVALFLICLAILVGAMMLASAVQKDFGNVLVSNLVSWVFASSQVIAPIPI